jgi:hypothetical protein
VAIVQNAGMGTTIFVANSSISVEVIVVEGLVNIWLLQLEISIFYRITLLLKLAP